jgi:hypothetical protein
VSRMNGKVCASAMRTCVIVLILCLGLCTSAVFFSLRARPLAGVNYTVSQVATALAHHPSAWIGRTVTVRGTIVLLTAYAMEDTSEGLDPPSLTVEQSFCVTITRATCRLTVPTHASVYLYLVDRLPRGVAYKRLAAELTSTQSGVPVSAAVPAYLIVHTTSSRAQNIREQLVHAILGALARIPLLGSVVTPLTPSPQQGTISGGMIGLYRVRLLAPPRHNTRQIRCKQVCANAMLLDSPT